MDRKKRTESTPTQEPEKEPMQEVRLAWFLTIFVWGLYLYLAVMFLIS